MEKLKKFEDLLGKVLIDAQTYPVNDSEPNMLVFTLDSGDKYALLHYQDCCEWVYLQDIAGDLEDLLDSPILLAEEVVSEGVQKGIDPPEYCDGSITYTFYKLATNKGRVTLRWCGSSNGYYSEEVDFVPYAT